MISVTNNYIWLKCYLNFNVIVAGGMRSCKTLARAINHKYSFLEKKLKEIVYSFLSTLTTNSSSSANIVHEILSFSDKFNALTISEGIVVRRDFECDACKFATDSTSNNFIPPFLFFLINIFVNILYICYPQIYYI